MTTRAAAKNKIKKPLQTTLGKAPTAVTNDPVDLSHVGKTIHTSLFGLKPVLALFETATEEVQSYITYECDIMYECRICRTIFRSLANFVLHKRNYCQESYNRRNHTALHPKFSETDSVIMQDDVLEESGGFNKEDEIGSTLTADSNPKMKQVDDFDLVDTKKLRSKKSLCSILPRLVDKQESALITEECLAEDNSNESTHFGDNKEIKNNIALQNINSTSSGVFQTVFQSKNNKLDFMKTEVMEIHDILENNEAIVGSNGKIIVPEGEKNAILKNNFLCVVCNQKFSTKKTLTYHINYKHNSTRRIYQCTECTDTFANTWGVFRHLYKTHRKTPAQVKKLRSQIHSNKIRNDEQLVIQNNDTKPNCTESSKTQEKLEAEEQQWIDNLEGDNDLQRCGGCGRKFERKAALHSHSQFCTKRIALCNSIKENNLKRVQEEKQDKIPKVKAFECVQNSINGSRRRKPLVAHKILRYDYTKDKCDRPIVKHDSTNNQSVQLLPEKSIEKLDDRTDGACSAPESEMSDNKTNANTFEHVLKTDDSNKNAEECVVSQTEVLSLIDSKIKTHTDEIEISETKDNISLTEDKNIENVINHSSRSSSITKEKLKEDCDKPHLSDNITIVEDITTGVKNIGNDTSVDVIKTQNFIDDSLSTNFDIVENHSSQNMSLKKDASANIKKIDTVINNSLPSTSVTKRKLEETSKHPKRKCKESHMLHLKSIDYIDQKKVVCLPCNITFKSCKSLMRHMALHFNWHRYQCKTCQYLSYQRCKCEHHIVKKHSITSKTVINSLIIHLPYTKTIELSTDFTANRKSIVPACAKVNEVQTVPVEHVNESNVTLEADAEEATVLGAGASNTEDSKVREMIMEVIFGSKPVSTPTPLNAPKSDPNIDNSPIHTEEQLKPSVLEQPTNVEGEKIEDTSTGVDEKLMDDTFTVKDTVRPVRNRTATARKDFLYDMTQILKVKPNKVKESALDMSSKQKPLKMYTRKTKPAVAQHSKNFKLIEDVNMNNKTVPLAKFNC